MSAVSMEGTIDKCLAFCQALVSSNQKFTFTLSIGKDTFKFENKELAASSCIGKKKKSPSQIRREARRREARKLKTTEEVAEVQPNATLQHQEVAEKTAESCHVKSTNLDFKCEQCDYKSTSDKGLKQHTRMKHRKSEVVDVTAAAKQAEVPVPPPPTPLPSAPSPSPPVVLKKPVRMLNGDPVSVKKK